MRLVILLVGALFLCMDVHAEESSTVTLSSGVSMTEDPACSEDGAQAVSIKKAKAEYQISVRAFFRCNGSFVEPWISPSVNSRATLVIEKKKPFGFSSNCECLHNLKVSVASNKINSRDTLYILTEGVVAGHVKVP